MKKRILSILMILFLAFTIPLTGCKEKGLENNPPLEATVTSNGGMSVIKGDYLYFVNGYVEESSLTKDDNKAGKVTKGAIYRTKLDNNEIVKDIDGFLYEDRTDLVVSKVVGFSNGGFRIIDNNIYYATPYMKLSSDGTLQTSRVEFHRVNIDGTKDEVIFVTSGTLTEWTIYKIDTTPYLVVYENSKIVSVNASNGKTVGTVENSSSYKFLEETEYVYNASRTTLIQTNVIYTRSISQTTDKVSNYKGNAVCAFNIVTGESETLELSPTNTYTIQNVTKDTIYYTYTSTAKPTACLYKKVIGTSWKEATEIKLTNRSYDSYVFVNYGNDLIIANGDSVTWLLEGGENIEPKVLISSEKTILAVYGDYAYYSEDNKLFRVNIFDDEHELENAYPEGQNSLITNDKYLDFDNRRIYVYAEYTAENGDSNYYLNYFNEDFKNSEFKQRFVGVFEKDDLPEKPEQPEPEYEGDEVEYVPHID
ncbi:MAG: hypothetical protein ACI4PF_06690 [Christensenellales bacterium]